MDSGYGRDKKIVLERFYASVWGNPFSKIIVESDSEILFEGDLIYTRVINIFNYTGWMSGHHLHFLLLVMGHCDKIDIYGYR